MWPMLPNPEWDASSAEERRDMLHEEIGSEIAPGILAYVDGTPAGWVRVGPRPTQRRLARTRIVTHGSEYPPDDPTVWAVTCFSVPRAFRGLGVTRALLDAAAEHARSHGARVVEGYPIDISVGKTSANSLFVGALTTFEAAGFHVVARPTPKRAVVARDLVAVS